MNKYLCKKLYKYSYKILHKYLCKRVNKYSLSVVDGHMHNHAKTVHEYSLHKRISNCHKRHSNCHENTA